MGSAAAHTNGLFNTVAGLGLNLLLENLGEPGGIYTSATFGLGKHISPETSDNKLKKILKNLEQPIVVYCAVGYRSAIMAERLKALEHTNVFNLEGAIFVWATEGYPLEGSNKVHPFNSMGSLMLRDDLEAD